MSAVDDGQTRIAALEKQLRQRDADLHLSNTTINALKDRVRNSEEQLRQAVDAARVMSGRLDQYCADEEQLQAQLKAARCGPYSSLRPPARTPQRSHMISEPFVPWWDEAMTGPALTCEVCGCMMVRTCHDNIERRNPGWECLSCDNYLPDKEKT